MFVYKLSGCGLESRCSHITFKYRACFKQEVPWHSNNYRVKIHSKMRMWHDKNIHSIVKLFFAKFYVISISQQSCYDWPVSGLGSHCIPPEKTHHGHVMGTLTRNRLIIVFNNWRWLTCWWKVIVVPARNAFFGFLDFFRHVHTPKTLNLSVSCGIKFPNLWGAYSKYV